MLVRVFEAHSIWMLVRVFEAVARVLEAVPVHQYTCIDSTCVWLLYVRVYR